MQSIVVIEDESDIAELLRFNLERDGYKVTCFENGESGLRGVSELRPDLVLLDYMLPGLNGLDVCKEIRAKREISKTLIIMLTARNEEIDIVSGLEVGADDYVTKPFSYRVLIARIRALLRREKPDELQGKDLIRLGEIIIDSGKYEATAKGITIKLTATEFRLLRALARRPGWVFERSQLIDMIRGEQTVVTDRTIDVMVAGLRKKLGECGDLIETVRGVGYRAREVE